jgi:hypothetical protein
MRSYLPSDLQIEGVDAPALLDIVNGIDIVGSTLSLLPERVRAGIVMDLETHLQKSNYEVPPLTKFVIDVISHACKDSKSVAKIKEQLSSQ